MRRSVAAPLLLVLAVLLAGLPPRLAAQEATPAADGGVLRVDQGFYPLTIDPQQSADLSEIAVSILDYEGLTRLDADLRTVPAAAESWAFGGDGTVLTFRLRDGLTYADGSPLTAERFRYAVERACDPRTAAPYAVILFDVVGCEELSASLDAAAVGTPGATRAAAGGQGAYEAAKANLGVRAVDGQTLEVRLTHPAAYFPTVASTWVFYPVKQEAVERDPEGWWRDPAARVGNGPFRATAIEEDRSIAFAANGAYWAGRPRLDGIAYVYRDQAAPEEEAAAAALAAYRAGALDVMFPSPPQAAEIADDPVLGRELLRYPAAGTEILAFDLGQEPFQDKKVREAFAYGFDRAAYCAEVGGGCAPALSWVPPGVPGHIETEAYAFDPERARRALAESTYGGPEGLPEIRFPYGADDPAPPPPLRWIADRYRDVLGVEIAFVPTTDEEFAAMDEAGAVPQLSITGWFQDYPDPQNWLSIYWACGSQLYAGRAGYCNEEFDDLVRRADAEADPARRRALYEEAGRLLVADTPAVFLSNPTNVALVKPAVTGYALTPSDLWPGAPASLPTIGLAPAAATPAAATPAP
jgi:oligopeptide transport system substrate-binding protein